jgi:hypothetical protein
MKTKRILYFIVLIVACTSLPNYLFSQLGELVIERTAWNHPEPGYFFLGPLGGRYIAVYDNSGFRAYYKDLGVLAQGVFDFKMQPNGKLTAYEVEQRKFIVMDSSFNVLDTVGAVGYNTDFHDFLILPDGNYLVIAEVIRTIDMRQLIPDGHPSAQVKSFILQKINRLTKEVMWEWDALDHYSVLDATEDIDLNSYSINPFHINSVSIANDGNLLISCRHLDEITKINIQNGNIMWRMGGSKSRRNQFRFVNDTVGNFFGFSHQHNVIQLSNGNILLFDNGNLKPNPYSRAVEYQIDESNRTARKVWEFRHPENIVSTAMGSVQRLPNGNTVIGWGGIDAQSGHNYLLTEVTQNGTIALELVGSAGTYRAYRYIFKMDAVSLNVASIGTYSFSNSQFNTNATLQITSLNGNGKITIEKHRYEPVNIPATGPCSRLPYRWLITKQGINSFAGKIIISLDGLQGYSNAQDLKIYFRQTEGAGDFAELSTTYNAQYNRLEANVSGYGELCIGTNSIGVPIPLAPANNSINQPLNVTISWSKFMAGELYDIQISKNQNFDTLFFETTNLRDTFFVLRNLEAGTTYYWRVRGVRTDCISSWSTTQKFTTLFQQVSLLAPDNEAKNVLLNVRFSWLPVQGAETYHFQLSTDSKFSSTIKDTALINSFIEVANLNNYTQYYWRVRLRKGENYGLWSTTRTFTTIVGPPILLSPANKANNVPIEGELSWLPAAGATHYSIVISKSPQFIQNIIENPDVYGTSFHYQGLEYFTEYYWKVHTIGSDGKSDWSETRMFKTQLAPPKLTLPTNGDTLAPTKGILRWEEVPFATGYVLQITTDPNFEFGIISHSLPKTTFFVYSQFIHSMTYYWRVKAIEANSESPWSEIHSFTTVPENFLTPPILIYPRDNTKNFRLSDKLIWLGDQSANTYQVQISTDLVFINIIQDQTTTDTSFGITLLPYGTKFYWRVRSINDKMQSNWSQTYSFTTALRTPSLFSPLDKSENLTLPIEFVWERTGSNIFFKLQVAYDKDFEFVTQEMISYDNNNVTIQTLPEDTWLYWRVMSYNSALESDWSTARTFKIAKTSNVANDLEDAITIAPNPFKDFLIVQFPSTIEPNPNVIVYDALGRELFRATSTNNANQVIWNSYGLSPGIYFVHIIMGRQIKIFKVSNIQ